MPVLDPKRLVQERAGAIEAFHAAAGLAQAELDVSGGVDSAVVLGLLVKALGAKKVTAVYMGIDSSAASLARAREVTGAFGVPLVELNLTAHFNALWASMVDAWLATAPAAPWWGGPGLRDNRDRMAYTLKERLEKDPTIRGSFRSCLRAPVGRGLNRIAGGGIRHGTGNEDEDRFLRFYQKGGDGEVDTNPIAMLSKGEVYQLAIALDVPRTIVEAVPSPDLWGNGDAHNDEAELASWAGVPFTYSRVDPATGAYRTVGTIERVARLLDQPWGWGEAVCAADVLFSDSALTNAALNELVLLACASNCFTGDFDHTDIADFLVAARRVERQTRHKVNPNIPMLGTRSALVESGILTNNLANGE